jgi:protein phosphatase
VVPEHNEQHLSTGDKVLLCSDGLWDMLSDEEIHSIVMEGGSPEEVCKRLIDKANEAGGEDNITVVMVQVGEKTGSEGLKDKKN